MKTFVTALSLSLVVLASGSAGADPADTGVRFVGERGTLLEWRARARTDWATLCVAPCTFELPTAYDADYRVRTPRAIVPVPIVHDPGRVMRVEYQDHRGARTGLIAGSIVVGAAGLVLVGLAIHEHKPHGWYESNASSDGSGPIALGGLALLLIATTLAVVGISVKADTVTVESHVNPQ
jgi:hypothetical protein